MTRQNREAPEHERGRRGSIPQRLAAVPGVIVLARILKNHLDGIRQRLHLGSYRIDGVTHLHKNIDESVTYVVDVFEDYFRYGGIEKEAIEGKKVLEIGPGDSLGVALLMAGLGARQVVSIDRFFTYRDPTRERQILARLVDAACPVAKARMKGCLDGENRIVGDVIGYIPDLPIERAFEEVGRTRFDYIVSRSVLEHVSDIDETYASCRTLIEDGGLMIHKVDLSNHSTIEPHPLQFLTYSQRLWGAMSSNISRVNRARWPQHRVSIERNRFTIERFVATKLLEIAQVRSIRPRLRSPFREMTDEELRICGFHIACRAV